MAQYLRETMVPATLLLLALLAIGGDCGRSHAIHHCLEFDVLCTADDFEVRRYNELVWVGTQVNGNNHQAFRAARRALRMYTRGSNVEEVWIGRTGQLLVSVAENGERNLFMLLPTQVQNNPPTPTDPQVFIQRIPSMEVFVREIGFGNAKLEGSLFNQTLTDEGAQFNDTTFFVALCRRGRHRRGGPRVKRSSSMSASEDASDASGDSNSDEEDRRRRSAVEGLDVALREERSASDDASDTSGDSDSDEEDRRRRSAAEELDFMSGIDARRRRSPGRGRPRREIWFIATGNSNCPIP